MLYDKDIREPLFYYLEDRFGKCRIIEEKTMGRARADMIMVLPGEIVGIEIKSSADTYERLQKQVRNYNKFCDRNYLVVGIRHAKHAAAHVPDSWGIICIYEDNKEIIIEEQRPAGINTKCAPKNQLSWAWRIELDHMLAINHMPRYRQKSKAFIHEKLLAKVPWDVLKAQFCEELFQRDYTLWDEE
ncbi:MAG: MmcB family DNA repair protein [Butyrivibrio sp.]